MTQDENFKQDVERLKNKGTEVGTEACHKDRLVCPPKASADDANHANALDEGLESGQRRGREKETEDEDEDEDDLLPPRSSCYPNDKSPNTDYNNENVRLLERSAHCHNEEQQQQQIQGTAPTPISDPPPMPVKGGIPNHEDKKLNNKVEEAEKERIHKDRLIKESAQGPSFNMSEDLLDNTAKHMKELNQEASDGEEEANHANALDEGLESGQCCGREKEDDYEDEDDVPSVDKKPHD